MANEAIKTLRINIETALTGEEAYANLRKDMDAIGVSVKGFTSLLTTGKDGVERYSHSANLLSRDLAVLQKAAIDAKTSFINLHNATNGTTSVIAPPELKTGNLTSQISKERDDYFKMLTEVTQRALAEALKIQNNFVKESIDINRSRLNALDKAEKDFNKDIGQYYSERLATFRSGNAKAISDMDNYLNLEQNLRLAKGNATKTAEIKASEDIKAIRGRLSQELIAIENKLKDETIGSVVEAEKARVKAIKQSASEIIAIQKQIETAQAKAMARNLSADTFRDQAANSLSGLNNNLALQQSNRVNGAGSIQSQTTQAAQDELKVRQKLNQDILELEQQLRDGVIANRGIANAKKVVLERKAADEIIAIQRQLEAEQNRVVVRNSNADNFRREADARLAITRNLMALEQSIRVNGANSIQTIELEASQQEETIRQNLANRILEIEANLRSGVLADRTAANNQSIAAERQAANDILALQRRVETERSRIASNQGDASLYRQQTGQIVTELDRRLALEQSIRVNGAAHIRTIEIRAAQDELRIREQLSADLARIEHEIQQGRMSASDGASARARLIAATESQINSNRRLLETTQANAEAQNNHNNRLNEAAGAHRNLLVHVGEIIGAYRILNAALNYTQQALLNIPKAGLQQQATQFSLFGIFGTEEGTKNIEFIQKIADTAGQSIKVLQDSYRRYAPSAALAGATQDKVNQSFKDFAEVGTILHLPEEKINSLFLALDQMFAKGVVQSEEIKKQLGNVLPGAVEIGAQAIGKTPAQFMEAMKKNEVIATEFVPKFAALYRKIFGGPDDSVFQLVADKLQSNLLRTENSYLLLNQAIFSKTEASMNSVVKLIATSLDTITKNIEGISQVIIVLSELLVARLAVSLVAAVASIDILIARISTVTIALTGLSAPALAFTAGLSAIIGRMAGLSMSYNEATGFMVHYGNEQATITSYIEGTVIVTLRKLEQAFKDVDAAVEKLTTIKVNSFFDSMIPNKKDLDEFTAFAKAVQDVKDSMDGSMKKPLTMEEAYAKRLAELANSGDKSSEIMAEALKLDTDKLIASFNGKSALLVSEAIKQGRLKTNDEITRALAATLDIPKTEIAKGLSESEAAFGLDNAGLGKAITKQNALLALANAQLKQEGDVKIAELNRQKAALENSLKNTGSSTMPNEIEVKQKIIDIENQISNVQLKVLQGQNEKTIATERENAALQHQYDLITKNRTAIYDAIRWQETRVKDDTDATHGTKGIWGGQGAGAISGSKADLSKGSMQITEAAWMETGREQIKFAKANLVDLAQAGREYFDLQLKEFKDLNIALAAYNQGPNAVKAIYTKLKIKVGTEDPEEQQQIKNALTEKMKKYANAVTASIAPTKGDINAINLATKEVELKGQILAKTQENAQAEQTRNQDNLVFLNEYKNRLDNIKADSLTAQGKTGEAETLRLNIKYRQEEAMLLATSNKEAYDQLQITKQYETSLIAINSAEKNVNLVRQAAAQAEKSVIAEQQAGMLSMGQASSRITEIRSELSKKENEYLDVLKKEAAVNKDNLNIQEKLNLEIARRQNLLADGRAELASATQKGGSPDLNFLNEAGQQSTNNAASRDKALTNLNSDPRIQNEQDLADAQAQIWDKYRLAQTQNNLGFYSGLAGVGAKTFMGLTQQMIAMHGAQSSQAKKAFAAYKAMAIAQAVIQTAQAMLAAYSSGLAYPFIGPATGAVFMGIAAALGAVQIAQIASQPMPQAHGGLDYVPENNQTYLLSKGERVLAPQQNRDFTKFINEKPSQQSANPQNIRIINAVDPSLFSEWGASSEGERVIMNVVSRNRG